MLKKSILISILSFSSSLVSFGNQLLIAFFFGATKEMDLFFSCTNFPLMLGALISISLSYFLVPHLKKQKLVLSSFGYKNYQAAFFKSISFKTVITFLFLGVLVFCYQKYILNIPSTLNNVLLYASALLTAFFLVIISILSAFNNVDDRYFISIAVSLLSPIGSLVSLVFCSNLLSTFSIQLGLLLGSVLGSFILLKDYIFIFHHRNKNEYTQTLNSFYKNIPYAIVAMLSFTVYQTIDAYWALKLGTSNVSYLGYLQRLIIAIGVVVISGPSVILVPKLTEYFVKEDKSDFINLSVKAINWVFILSTLFALCCSLLAKEIIQLLFQRAAFGEKDTLNMSKVLPFLLIGMCFMLSFSILFRIFFINESPQKSSFIGLLSALLYFVLSGLLSNFYSLKGICLAYLFTWVIIFFIAAYYTFRQYSKAFFNVNQLLFLVKTIALCAVIFFLFQMLLVKNSLNQNYILQIVSIAWRVIVITIVFFISGIYILRIKELKELISSVKLF